MATWRCPHCGAPQPETSRCWVCTRATATCATCLHFRRAIAGRFGYCGLDARRAPLAGDEQLPCWQAADVDPVVLFALESMAPARPH